MKRKLTIQLLWAVCIVFSLSSCKNEMKPKEGYAAPVFETIQQVTTNRILPNFLFGLGQISVVDSLLMYSGNTDLNEQLYHLFSINSGSYIRSFGYKGQGPGEVVNRTRHFVDHKDKMVYAYDMWQHKLVSYSLPDVLNEKSYGADLSFPSTVQNFVSQHLVYLNDQKFIVGYSSKGMVDNKYERNNRLMKTGLSDTIASIGIYPKLDEPEEYKNVEQFYFFYLGTMVAKPDGRRFAHATRSGCVMEIFDCEKDKIVPVGEFRFFKPNYKSKNRESRAPFVSQGEQAVNGIMSMFATDKYIYAAYDEGTGELNRTQFAVFDWEGNPIKKLQFEHKIICFYIDQNDRNGYVLVQEADDEITLHQFRL